MIDSILILIGAIGIIIGTITDFRQREVSDYLNYFLIASGLLIRFFSATLEGNWGFFLQGLAWAAIAYGFGAAMYYTGQWGGGDVKMIAGIGALMATYPVPNDILISLLPSYLHATFMIHFLINSFILGALYGIIWTIGLAIKKRKAFKKGWDEYMTHRAVKISFYFGISLFIITYAAMFLLESWFFLGHILAFMMLLTPALMIFVKVVEHKCMVVNMKVSDLTEGEWITKDVFVDKKKVYTISNTGCSVKDVKRLQKLGEEGKLKTVPVKIGIPFVPAFFLAFFITLAVGNIVFLII